MKYIRNNGDLSTHEHTRSGFARQGDNSKHAYHTHALPSRGELDLRLLEVRDSGDTAVWCGSIERRNEAEEETADSEHSNLLYIRYRLYRKEQFLEVSGRSCYLKRLGFLYQRLAAASFIFPNEGSFKLSDNAGAVMYKLASTQIGCATFMNE